MTSNTTPLVVTRHAGLVEYLRAEGLVPDGVEVVAHATPDVVRGRHVLGVLPHSLSCLTASYTEVALRLPPEARGRELTADEVRAYCVGVYTYEVRRVARAEDAQDRPLRTFPELSTHTLNALERNGVETIEQVLALDGATLARLRGVGRVAVRQLRKLVLSLGFVDAGRRM